MSHQNTTTDPPPPRSSMNGWEFDNPPTVTPFEFEKLDIRYWNDFMSTYSHYSIFIGICYILTIFHLQTWMSKRKAFCLKYPLFVWNVFLSIFSIVGLSRVSPPLLYVLAEPDGFYTSVCVKKGLNLSNVLWGVLFAMSKIWELGDTVFIILRKRRLVFLQVYHHLTTLLVTWTVAPLMEPIGRWYGSLNYGVHAVMYPYFALKTVGVSVPDIVKRSITVLQFTQMIIGFGVNLASLYYQHMGYKCDRELTSVVAFTILYGSFTFAFADLIFQRADDDVSRRKQRNKNE